jgi:RNA polymerase sigma-70 factor (ECF subfamily)
MEEAQDATQEIFVKVFAGLRHFRHESSLSTYIYTIALNYCKTELRKQSTVKRSGIFQRIFFSSEEAHQSFVQWEHPGILLERKNQALVLMNAIHELAPAQRDALLLVKYQEFSYKEAAEIMGVSPSALDSLISRAMANLKKKYRR